MAKFHVWHNEFAEQKAEQLLTNRKLLSIFDAGRFFLFFSIYELLFELYRHET